MVAEVREVRVFVASPGDCDAERQRVRKVADDVNTALGTTFGLRRSVDRARVECRCRGYAGVGDG